MRSHSCGPPAVRDLVVTAHDYDRSSITEKLVEPILTRLCAGIILLVANFLSCALLRPLQSRGPSFRARHMERDEASGP